MLICVEVVEYVNELARKLRRVNGLSESSICELTLKNHVDDS